MRAMLSLFLVAMFAGCQPSPVAAESTVRPESQASAMPESLRCGRAADCMPEPTCYWGTPSCVAAATAVVPKCEDADPADASREKFTCGCQEGQCVAQTQ